MIDPRIVSVRGTNEPLRGGMTEKVILGHPRTDVLRLTYPAAIFPIGLETLPQSVLAGRKELHRIDNDGPWIGVGYSLGAYLLGHAYAADGLRNCRGIVLIADPLRHRGQCANPGVPGDRWGIAGERWIPGNVKSFAIPDDPITSLPGSNPTRYLSDVITGRRQPFGGLWPIGAGGSALWRYLGSGRHTAYGTDHLPDGRTYLTAARDAVKAML